MLSEVLSEASLWRFYNSRSPTGTYCRRPVRFLTQSSTPLKLKAGKSKLNFFIFEKLFSGQGLLEAQFKTVKFLLHQLVEKSCKMEDINKLEFSVLERLSNKYPTLKKHLAYIKVCSREITGVGMYVNFCYSKNGEILESLNMPDTSISTNENIEIGGLKYGLAYEVDISNGKINFIEFATSGDEKWNGVANDFTFMKI